MTNHVRRVGVWVIRALQAVLFATAVILTVGAVGGNMSAIGAMFIMLVVLTLLALFGALHFVAGYVGGSEA